MIEKISVNDWLEAGNPKTFTDTVELKWMHNPRGEGLVSELIYLRERNETNEKFFRPLIRTIAGFMHSNKEGGVITFDDEFIETVNDKLNSMFIPSEAFLEDNPDFKEQYNQLRTVWILKNKGK